MPKQSFRHLRTAGAILAAALALNPTAEAAFEMVPDIMLTLGTTDNPRLRPGAKDDAPYSELSLQATFSSFNERGEFYVRPQIVASDYSTDEDSNLDSDDYFLRAFVEHRWTTTAIGFDADYSHEKIIDSDLFETIPNDPDLPDLEDSETGAILYQDEKRERVILAPYVSFAPSERSEFRVGGRYIDTQYSTPLGPDLSRTDYTESRLNLTFSRDLNQRHELSGRVYFSNYETQSLRQNTTDTTGVEAILTSRLSETWTAEITAGILYSDYLINPVIQPTMSDSVTNPRIEFALRKRSERTSLNLNLGRTVLPTSTGNMMQRDELNIYADQRLKERLSFFSGLRMGQLVPIGDVNALDEREYFRFEVGLEWRAARRLRLRTTFGNTLQRYPEEMLDDAKANHLTVSFSYVGLSRQ
jgi:hypothetical protein